MLYKSWSGILRLIPLIEVDQGSKWQVKQMISLSLSNEWSLGYPVFCNNIHKLMFLHVCLNGCWASYLMQLLHDKSQASPRMAWHPPFRSNLLVATLRRYIHNGQNMPNNAKQTFWKEWKTSTRMLRCTMRTLSGIWRLPRQGYTLRLWHGYDAVSGLQPLALCK